MSGDTSIHVHKWTADQLRFIEWLAHPKAEKQPKTQKQFAALIEVSEKTLCDWKKLDGFMEAVVQRSRDLVKDHIADTIGALVRGAKKGSIPHIDRVLVMAGLGTDVADAGKGAGNVHFNVLLTKVYGDDDDSSPATE